MTEQQKQQAIEVVKSILHALHGKRYEDLPKCVDEMEWADTDEIRECIQGTLELNDMSAFDEYGAPCNFHPQYEYHQMSFYPYKDGSGFALDYHLTADGGEMTDLCLQLIFLYQDGGLRSIFHMIDPM